MNCSELDDDNTFIKKSVREWKEDRNIFIGTGLILGALLGFGGTILYLSLPVIW